MRKPKRAFMDVYETYDESAGRGNAKQWRGAFRASMGFEEAEEILKTAPGDNSPLGILGLSGRPTWAMIKSAYRKMARKWHPDVNSAPEATKKMEQINAAYVVLEQRYGK